MSIGQSGAYNYRIPLNQQPQGYQPEPIGGEDAGAIEAQQRGAGLPEDRIANMRGKTKELYDNYALLESFARDMATKGIDVFKPDYSQEGGGLPFQAYHNLEASVRFAANDLKNEQKARDEFMPLSMRGEARATGPMDTTSLQDPNNVISMRPTYQVEETNRRLGEQTYTTADQNKTNAAYLQPTEDDIDRAVASKLYSAAQGEQYKQMLKQNTAQTSYQQLIPRGGSHKGPTPEDISRRAELIKQIKGGIFTKDPLALNMLRNAPGVEGADYVDDGERLGIEVYLKGADPSFIDLSAGAGEGEINALLSRITGQMKIPNEAVFEFDTSVGIPQSNSAPILQGLKEKMKSIPSNEDVANEILPSLQQMAAEGTLEIPDGVVMSIDLDTPNFISKMWRGNKLTIKYHPLKDGKVQATTSTKVVSSPEELESIIGYNANKLAPKFGSQVSRQDETPIGPVKVTNDAQYKALPSGSQYIGADGKTRIKK